LLEAWLGPRVHQPNVHMHEQTAIVAARTAADGTHDVLLDDDTTVNVHNIILATGYLPNMPERRFSRPRNDFARAPNA
jgi:lysine/ornithine N-monooxygenase